MPIVNLGIKNFRSIANASIDFDRRCTLVCGPNGSGKTTVLEAIHLLGSGRSFRTTQIGPLISHGSENFLLTALLEHKGRSVRVGTQCSEKRKQIHVDGGKVRSFAELAPLLPVRVIDPSGHKLIEEGPAVRRRYVDWGVFHVEPRFHELWREYSAALDQRNAAIKSSQDSRLVETWDHVLATRGEELSRLRQSYVDGLTPMVAVMSEQLLSATASLEFRRGWDGELSLSEALHRSLSRDVRFRSTTVGAHRAELDIKINGVLAKECVSRGQQKLLACALVLAQLQYQALVGKEPGALLLDDPAAELDVHNLGTLLRLVQSIPAQLIVTALDPALTISIFPGKKFHVKQGLVEPML